MDYELCSRGTEGAVMGSPARDRDAANGVGQLDDMLRIYVCTHTDFEPVVHSPVYEVADSRTNGDPGAYGLPGTYYSELATYKQIAARDRLPQYVGCCGYRKYFSFMDDIPDMREVFRAHDAVAASPIRLRGGVRAHYAAYHNVSDFDIVTEIVRDKYPEFFDTWDAAARSSDFYQCNMFILRRDDFRWVVDMVFGILHDYVQAVGTDVNGRIYSHPSDYHLRSAMDAGRALAQYRVGGFLGERIVNALLRFRFSRVKTYDMVVTAGRGERTRPGVKTVGGIEMETGVDHARLVELLTPRDIDGLTKVRLGNCDDGGYVVPRELVFYVSHLASCGIGNEVSFEADFLARNRECSAALYDSNPEHPDIGVPDSRFVFHAVTLGKDYSVRQVVDGHSRTLLKVDIEGAEYEMMYDAATGKFAGLQGVSVLVIELHNIVHHPKAFQLLADISGEMTLFHVHGNVFGGCTETPSGCIPNVVELTFVSKDIGGARYRPVTQYPVAGLDMTHRQGWKDLGMPFLNLAEQHGTFAVLVGGRTPASRADMAIQQLRTLYPGWRVCVVAPESMLKQMNLSAAKAEGVEENKVLSRDFVLKTMQEVAPVALRRVNWYYQQFLKYGFCNSPYNDGGYYVVADGDTIWLRRIRFTDGDKYLFNRKTEYWRPYFETLPRLFPGIDTSNPCPFGHSFISEYMAFDTAILREMLGKLGDDWIRTILEAAAKSSHVVGFSEYETYGTYMANFHKDRMRSIQLQTSRHGGHVIDSNELSWSKLVSIAGTLDTITFER